VTIHGHVATWKSIPFSVGIYTVVSKLAVIDGNLLLLGTFVGIILER